MSLTPNSRLHLHRAASSGFTLLEVLIAIVVLAIGLLGLAGLQASSLRVNHDAHLRSQATALAYDMADRMRANSGQALLAGSPYVIPFNAVVCNLNYAPAANLSVAANDIAEWRNQLACLLPRGDGRVTRAGTVFTVDVRWNEREDGNAANLQTFSFEVRLR